MDTQVKHLTETMGQIRQEAGQLKRDFHDLQERVTRLETLREADRAQMQAEIERFKLEVERAELRLSRLTPPATPTALPGSPPEVQR